MRDQRKALAALQSAASSPAAAAPGTARVPVAPPPQEPGSAPAPAHRSGEEGTEVADDGENSAPATSGAADPAPAPATASALAMAPAAGLAPVAAVERARISSLSGVVALIWLVTLVLMVWK